MSNAKPAQTPTRYGAEPTRQRRPRRTTPGDPQSLLRHLWYAVRRAEDVLDDPEATLDQMLRAVHAIAGVSNAWTRAHEVHSMQQELDALAQQVQELKQAHALPGMRRAA